MKLETSKEQQLKSTVWKKSFGGFITNNQEIANLIQLRF